MIKKFKIFENPDTSVYYDENNVIQYAYVRNEDAYPYIYDVVDNIVYLSKIPRLFHSDYIEKYRTETGINLYNIDTYIKGRIWFNRKIISFWEQPEKMTDFLNALEKAMKNNNLLKSNETIFNEDWRIDLDDLKLEPVINFKGILNIDPIEAEFHTASPSKKLKMIKQYPWLDKKRNAFIDARNAAKKGKWKKDDYPFMEKIKKFDEWQKPFESKINESPDNLIFNKNKLNISEVDAIPFALYEDENEYKIIYGKSDDAHYEIGVSYYDDKYKYHGRLWKNSKVMSFWNYPEPKEFVKLIDNLEKTLDIKIWNNGWQVEILKDNDKQIFNNNIKKKGDNTSYRSDYIEELVPVEKYSGSNIRDKEELNIHLAKDKSNILKSKGYKPKIKQWKEWQKPFESLNNKLFENPDKLFYNKEDIIWSHNYNKKYLKNLSFSYYTNKKTKKEKLYLYTGTHTEMFETLFRDDEIIDPNKDGARGYLSGRLFVNERIISFWMFPKNQEELRKVAKDIKRNTGIDIYKDKYLIEIVTDEDISNISTSWYNTLYSTDFIPVEDYKSSKKRTEEEIKKSHDDSPIEKEKKEKIQKIKNEEDFYKKRSEYFRYKKHTPLNWKQALLKSENKNNIDDNTI